MEIDDKLNEELNRKEGIISPENNNVKVMVIPTNEELVIAKETVKLIEQKRGLKCSFF
jgi:acetate kinase